MIFAIRRRHDGLHRSQKGRGSVDDEGVQLPWDGLFSPPDSLVAHLQVRLGMKSSERNSARIPLKPKPRFAVTETDGL